MTGLLYKQTRSFIILSAVFIGILAIALFSGYHLILVAAFGILLAFAGWQDARLLFYLLIFSLPFSFEYNFSAELGTDVPDEFLMALLSFFAIAWWVYSPKILTREMLNHPLIVLLAIGFIWAGISALFSTNEIFSYKFLLAKTWYIGAFVLAPLLFVRDKSSITRTAILLIASVFSIVIISLIRHSADNFSFATINDAVRPFFRNHVNYSAMLVCIIPVLVAGILLTKKASPRFLLVMVLLVMLLATFVSYARGAWLALIIGGLTWGLIRIRSLVFAYVLAIVVGLGILFYLKQNDRYLRYAHDYQTTIFHKDFKEHIIATYKLKDVSTAERFYRWIAGVRMIRDKWLTGYGPATFYDNYKPYAVPAFKTWVSDNKEHSTVHNYFILVAVEQGIPGLLFFIVLLGCLLYYSQHLYHRIRDPFYRTAAITIGVIVSMIITVNFLSDLIETDKIGSLFFLSISFLIITDLNTRKNS